MQNVQRKFVQFLFLIKTFLINPVKMLFSRIMYEKNKKRILKLKNKECIRVVFLVANKSIWKTDHIFNDMLKDDFFDPMILVIPTTGINEELQTELISSTYQYFLEKNYPTISSFDEKNNCWIKLESIAADILFFSSPHKQTVKEYYETAYKKYPSCYAGYGMHTARYGLNQGQYNKWFHNSLWKVFVQNQNMVEDYQRYSNIKKDHIHLVLDNIVEDLTNPERKEMAAWENSDTKKRIIWAPHHTINKNDPLQLATFLQYADFFQQLAERTKEHVIWCFKPHPVLKNKMYNHPNWGKERTDQYYTYWKNSEYSQINEGEYIDLFRQSDALIHDSASFIAEYHFTKKPMLFLMANHTRANLNEFGLVCLDAADEAWGGDDIESFVNKVIDETIGVKNQQKELVDKYFLDLKNESGSLSVSDIIKNGIKQAH
ncbi:CDP-glycerol glycerophosphotransferase family protein [Acinetobacter towneri]|uniref:CDP-glycerol glycerophosphotransferase family protein n=1 Tax=Acinetobacter towneri TaxID=202956 RepID=UPI0014441632|nr:CDP-glycerol glycerophosphotransferase family protein [Acinetobacter towneri]